LRRLGWTILAAAAIVVLWRASNMLLLAFGSVLGAVMFRSAGRMIQRLGLRNWRAALTFGTLLVLALFGLIGYLLVVQFGSEIGGMVGNLPGTIASIERGLGTTKAGHALVEAAHVAVGGGEIATRLGQMLLGGGEILVNFAIVVVGAIFIAADADVDRFDHRTADPGGLEPLLDAGDGPRQVADHPADLAAELDHQQVGDHPEQREYEQRAERQRRLVVADAEPLDRPRGAAEHHRAEHRAERQQQHIRSAPQDDDRRRGENRPPEPPQIGPIFGRGLENWAHAGRSMDG
jgi:hypothetical protein